VSLNSSWYYPLSLMLFLLVMEVLNALIRKVEEWSLLQ
jgi:hypothetical protein